MQIVIKHKDSSITHSTETFFLNKTNDEAYCRLVGGLAWPGIEPGFTVILAEDLKEDETLKKRHLRILAEYESQNPSDLVRRAKEYQAIYSAEQFYGDTQNESMMDIMQRSQLGFYLNTAPFIDDPEAFSSYLLRVRELTLPTRKLLHFSQKSRLPALLSALDPRELSSAGKSNFQRFPAVTALGFAIAGLQTTVYDPYENILLDQLNNELSILHGD